MVLLVRGVRAEDQTVRAEVSAFFSAIEREGWVEGRQNDVLALRSNMRKPLGGQARPFQRVRDDQIVEKRCVLLPDFVLFVDSFLFDVVFEFT